MSSTLTRRILMGAYLPELDALIRREQRCEKNGDLLLNGFRYWMLDDPAVDLHKYINEGPPRGNIHAGGLHRRAITAMRAISMRKRDQVRMCSFTRRRELEDECDDVCCEDGETNLSQYNFVAYSPLGDDPFDHREVWILGSMSSGLRVCTRDRLLVHSSSNDGSDGTTFIVEGCQSTESSEYLQRGLRRTGNHHLVGEVEDLKFALSTRIMGQHVPRDEEIEMSTLT